MISRKTDFRIRPASQSLIRTLEILGLLLWVSSSAHGQIDRTLRNPEIQERFESVGFAHNDEWVVAGTSRRMTVWDYKTGEVLRQCELETRDSVWDFAGEAVIYKGAEGQLSRCRFADLVSEPLGISGKWHPLSVSKNGRLLCEDPETRGQLQVFELKAGQGLLKRPLKVSDRFTGATLSPDGKRIVVTFGDKEDAIRAFDLDKQTWDATSGGFLADASYAQWSPDGQWLAMSCSRGGQQCVSFVNAQTLRPVGKPYSNNNLSRSVSYIFSPDSQRLLLDDNEDPLLFDVATQQLLTTYYGMRHGDRSKSFSFASKGSQLAAVGREAGTVELWDWQAPLRFRQPSRTVATHVPVKHEYAHNDYHMHVRYQPDGQLVVLAVPNPSYYGSRGSVAGNVMASIRDNVADGKVIKGSDQPLPSDVANLVWLECQTGKVLATVSSKGLQAVFVDEDGEKDIVRPDGYKFHSLSFSSDGKFLSSLCDNWVVLWERTAREVRPRLVMPNLDADGKNASWRSGVISLDGTQLHLVCDNEEHGYQVFDVGKGKRLQQFSGKFGYNLTFVNDVQVVSGLSVFNRKDGSEEFRANRDNADQFVTVKGLGHSVIGGRWGSVLQLDIESSRISSPFAAHTTDRLRVHGFAASQDGQLVATACADALIRLWQTSNGRLLAVLKGHAAAVDSVDFAPNGKELVSASRDGTTRFWDISDLSGDAPKPAVAPQLPTTAKFQPNAGVTITVTFDRVASPAEVAAALEAAAAQARIEK